MIIETEYDENLLKGGSQFLKTQGGETLGERIQFSTHRQMGTNPSRHYGRRAYGELPIRYM